MRKPFTRIRGIRSPIPAGHIIGRNDAKKGPPHPIKLGKGLTVTGTSSSSTISTNTTSFTGDVTGSGSNITVTKLGGRDLTIGLPAPSFTVAGVPAATPAGNIIYVSNESGGAVLAFSDGTNWRRVTDRAIIS